MVALEATSALLKLVKVPPIVLLKISVSLDKVSKFFPLTIFLERSIDKRSDGDRSQVSKTSSVGFALKDAIKGRFSGRNAKKSPMHES